MPKPGADTREGLGISKWSVQSGCLGGPRTMFHPAHEHGQVVSISSAFRRSMPDETREKQKCAVDSDSCFVCGIVTRLEFRSGLTVLEIRTAVDLGPGMSTRTQEKTANTAARGSNPWTASSTSSSSSPKSPRVRQAKCPKPRWIVAFNAQESPHALAIDRTLVSAERGAAPAPV